MQTAYVRFHRKDAKTQCFVIIRRVLLNYCTIELIRFDFLKPKEHSAFASLRFIVLDYGTFRNRVFAKKISAQNKPNAT